MKFLNNLKMASLAMLAPLGLAAAAPAMAQTAPSTTTSPTSTTCTTGCPNSVTVTGVAAFGGLVVGGFGAVDSQGKLVAGSNITGKVEGSKIGGGDTKVGIVYSGCGSLTCTSGNLTVNAEISAFERGQMAVTATSAAPGQMVALSNSGTLGAAAGLSIALVAPTPTPTH